MKVSCYLHQNGDLIFKHYNYEYEGDLVKRFWRFENFCKADAVNLLNEAKSFGISERRLKELENFWGLIIKEQDNGANVK